MVEVTVVEESIKHQIYLTVSILILTIIWYLRSRNDKNRIPGPRPLPLIGNAHQLGRRPYETFMKWGKMYGPIVHLKLASENMVVLNDPAMIKELFNDPLTSGRSTDNNPVVLESSKGSYGILNADGCTWEAQRRFTLRTLREFGFAKASMESLILTEVNAIVDWFKKRQNVPLSGDRIFEGPALNVLWNIVSGERCDWENDDSTGVGKASDFIRSLQTLTDNGLYFVPFLRHIFPELMGWTKFQKCTKDLHDLFDKLVQEHKKKLDKSNLRDFIDYYLKEIEDTEDEQSSFYKETGHLHLFGVLMDLFVAGSVTTSGSLSWFLLYMSCHQEVQKKMQNEIDRVIGSSGSPSISDRTNMPYTEAVILETLRHSAVTPSGAPHRVLSDMNYKGYLFKKDTTILANLYAAHHDPKIWGETPEAFNPKRFLNDDETKVIRREEVISFSEGKRRCIGEKLARDEIFLFATGILQIFNILSDSEQDMDKKPSFEAETGLFVRVPKSFRIVVTTRN